MKKPTYLPLFVCLVFFLSSCNTGITLKCDENVPARISEKLNGVTLKDGENTIVLDSTVSVKITVKGKEITEMEWMPVGEEPIVLAKEIGPGEDRPEPPRDCKKEQDDCKRQNCLMHPDTGEPDCGLSGESKCYAVYQRCKLAGGRGLWGGITRM